MNEASSELLVREHILNSLRLSNDIYRNGYDAEFATAGGEIIYCFDSTVFNLFYDTARWRHAVTSFHSQQWAVEGRGRQWGEIEVQSALIASEYLLSDRLPGLRSRNVYLTPWHRQELARSVSAVLDDSKRAAARDEINNEVETKVAALRCKRDDTLDYVRGVEVAGLDKDLLRLYGPEDDSPRRRYALTRIAAAILARSERSERMDQLHRIVSRPLMQRITGLHTLFSPTTKEQSHLRMEAEKWYWRIKEEIGARRPSSRRTDRGEWHDARSLAFVQWASANRLRRDQRLVLVTSDDVLFDVYRHWWVGQTPQTGEEEPFLLRRSFQYTPLFNLSDAGSDLTYIDPVQPNDSSSPAHRATLPEVRALFSRIQEAVEISLLPFNLASLGRSSIGSSISILRGREHLALRVGASMHGKSRDDVLGYFMSTLSDQWYRDQAKALREIARLWRDMERISIGLFHGQIFRRLEDEQTAYGIEPTHLDSPTLSREILEYFNSSLDVLASNSRTAWLPTAIDFLLEQMENSPPGRTRVPEILWYRLPNGHTVYDIAHTDKAARQELLNPADLQESPEAAFIMASAFALQHREWWRAEEFARYAVTSIADHGSPDVSSRWEAKFLLALCKRFRLGAMNWLAGPGSPAVSTALPARALTVFQEARRLLDEYVRAFPQATASTHHYIRGRSERAALFLFAVVAAKHLGDTWSGDSADRLVIAAQDDIRACLAASKAHDDGSQQAKELRRHFVHNAAASELLRFLRTPSTYEPAAEFAALAGELRESLSNVDFAYNPLLYTEKACFLALCGKLKPSEWPNVERRMIEGLAAELPVDCVMFNELYANRDALFRRLAQGYRIRA